MTYTTLNCAEDEINYVLEHVIDYYPYGKVMREYVGCSVTARYMTTHHERDEESGLDYRGARFYDSDIGRFLSLDPLAVEFPAWSAYNYVLGNPVAFIDQSGKAPSLAIPPVKIIYYDFQIAGGLGGVGGAGFKFQRGVAYDDYGVTMYEGSTSGKYLGVGKRTDGHNPDNIISGIDSGLSIGFLYDNDAATFEEVASKQAANSFAVAIGDLEIGADQIAFDAGIGAGLAMTKMNLNINSSLSVSKPEWNSLGGTSLGFATAFRITVENTQPILDLNNNTIGFSGEVVTYNLFGKRTNIGNGINVKSGYKMVNGKAVTNDIWKSEEYQSSIGE